MKQKITKTIMSLQGDTYLLELSNFNNSLKLSAVLSHSNSIQQVPLNTIPYEGTFSFPVLQEKNRCFTLTSSINEVIQLLIQIIDLDKAKITSFNNINFSMRTTWSIQAYFREESFDLLLKKPLPSTRAEFIETLTNLKQRTDHEISQLHQKNNTLNNEITSLKNKITQLETNLTNVTTEFQNFKNSIPNNVIQHLNRNQNNLNIGASTSSYIDLNKIVEIHKFDNNHDAVRWIVALEDGRVATCSKDKSINVYNIKDRRTEISVQNAHEAPIYYIEVLKNGNLVTGDYNGNLKVWNVSRNSVTNRFSIQSAHEKTIFTIYGRKHTQIVEEFGIFYTGAGEGVCKMWNTQTLSSRLVPVRIFERHNDSIRSIIELQSRKILVTSSREGDCSLKFWKLDDYNQRNYFQIIEGIYCNAFNMVEINNDKLIVGGENNLYIVDTINYRIEKKLEKSLLNAIYSINLVSDTNCLLTNYSGLLIFVDLEEMIVTGSKEFSRAYIYNLIFLKNDKKIVTVSEDSTVKILKFYN